MKNRLKSEEPPAREETGWGSNSVVIDRNDKQELALLNGQRSEVLLPNASERNDERNVGKSLLGISHQSSLTQSQHSTNSGLLHDPVTTRPALSSNPSSRPDVVNPPVVDGWNKPSSQSSRQNSQPTSTEKPNSNISNNQWVFQPIKSESDMSYAGRAIDNKDQPQPRGPCEDGGKR